ncbi:MAG: hypothetical protein ACJAYJ_004779 [Saprospiraceae bacterium]|jgi:hypothetical protein
MFLMENQLFAQICVGKLGLYSIYFVDMENRGSFN